MEKILDTITTSELLSFYKTNAGQIIDVRPVDAYNGWTLEGEARGGHIPGARSLPHKWISYIDWIEIVRSKGIMTDQPLVLYGYSEHKATSVAKMFQRAGYNKTYIYRDFVKEWSENPDMPMEYLKRYRNLVSPGWVKTLIDGGRPPHYDNDKFVICHAHYRNRNAYLEGHIPGAVDLDTLDLESPETWNRRSPAELKDALEKHGITSDTTVILYGRFMYPDNKDPFPGSAAGQLGAMRCAFIMLYAGVKDVRVLNGGFQSWKDANYEISTDDISPMPVEDFGSRIPAHPELAVDLPEAKELLASDTGDLVSVRSWPEFIGEVSGYNYIEKKGRIPGAIYGNCGTDAYHMENYRNLDHTTRETNEIVSMWSEAGITPDKHLAFYCGTGWRGSEAFFNAWLMGWPKVSVYDGGWFEWSNDPGNPVETGIPVEMQE